MSIKKNLLKVGVLCLAVPLAVGVSACKKKENTPVDPVDPGIVVPTDSKTVTWNTVPTGCNTFKVISDIGDNAQQIQSGQSVPNGTMLTVGWEAASTHTVEVKLNGIVISSPYFVEGITENLVFEITATAKPVANEVQSVTLSAPRYGFAWINDKIQLTANVVKTGTATAGVNWISRNESIATVDENGVVTLKAATAGQKVKIAAVSKFNSLKLDEKEFTFSPLSIAATLPTLSLSRGSLEGKDIKVDVTNAIVNRAKSAPSDTANITFEFTKTVDSVATVNSIGYVAATGSGDTDINIKVTIAFSQDNKTVINTTLPVNVVWKYYVTAVVNDDPYALTKRKLYSQDTNINDVFAGDDKLVASTPASRYGYNFAGWLVNGAPLASQTITQDITLTAKWTRNTSIASTTAELIKSEWQLDKILTDNGSVFTAEKYMILKIEDQNGGNGKLTINGATRDQAHFANLDWQEVVDEYQNKVKKYSDTSISFAADGQDNIKFNRDIYTVEFGNEEVVYIDNVIQMDESGKYPKTERKVTFTPMNDYNSILPIVSDSGNILGFRAPVLTEYYKIDNKGTSKKDDDVEIKKTVISGEWTMIGNVNTFFPEYRTFIFKKINLQNEVNKADFDFKQPSMTIARGEYKAAEVKIKEFSYVGQDKDNDGITDLDKNGNPIYIYVPNDADFIYRYAERTEQWSSDNPDIPVLQSVVNAGQVVGTATITAKFTWTCLGKSHTVTKTMTVTVL